MNGWQTSSTPASKPRRAFVGNLRQQPNLEERLRSLFSKSAISVKNIEIIPLKQPSDRCFALIQCDVEMAIKCINGVSFDGNILEVKSEKKKKQGRKKQNMGFGGGWATPKNSAGPFSEGTTISGSKAKGKNIGQPKGISDEKLKSKEKQNEEKHSSKSSATNVESLLATGLDRLNIEGGGNAPEDLDDVSHFNTRCKVSLSDLMKEYGTYDPDYEKMKSMNVESNSIEKSKTSSKSVSSEGNGALVPNGKAPIHIELVSFGYKYSVPPQAREGWSHSNPLSPIDCRVLPRCPHYVAKLSGLSHKVKRAMLSMKADTKEGNDSDEEHDSPDNEDEKDDSNTVSPMLDRSEKESSVILSSIQDAIDDGGHGYAFPLETKIWIGSEYGRHRSVVLCEHMAQTLRKLLRENEGNKIKQPVSVSTRHRDVDNNHRDEEAFGKDLRREHQAEVKRKKKQEWLESRW